MLVFLKENMTLFFYHITRFNEVKILYNLTNKVTDDMLGLN